MFRADNVLVVQTMSGVRRLRLTRPDDQDSGHVNVAGADEELV